MTTTLRREQIAEAALSLVADQGVGALTARNVAKAIGVTAPALYRHFPGGKADILASVLDLLDAVKFQGLREAIDTPGNTLDKLYTCFSMHIRTMQRYRALPNLVLADTLWDDVPELRDRLYTSHNKQQQMTAELIARGQARGEIRTDVSPDEIFVQFLGQFLTLAILYSRHGNMIDLEAQAKANWKMFVRATAPLT